MSSSTEHELTGVDARLLPPQMRQLVAIIGLAQTLKLLEARGGTPLRIPKEPNRAEVLPEILSFEAVCQLAAALGGQKIDLPKCDKIVVQIRNLAIKSARNHKTAPQLAREYGLTRRHIINIAKAAVDDRQADLFEPEGDTHG